MGDLSEEDKIRETKRYAAFNAEPALVRAKDCRRLIFEVDLSGLEYKDDTSCPNMEGAVYIEGYLPPERIVAAWVDKESLDLLRGYFLSGKLNRRLAEPISMSPLEEAIARLFQENSSIAGQAFELLSDSVDNMIALDIRQKQV